MGNLAYIDELGIGSDEPTNDDGELNNDTQDGLNDSDDSTLTDDESKTSETDTERLMKQITALEKRISDKDAYINELRKESQKKVMPKHLMVKKMRIFGLIQKPIINN